MQTRIIDEQEILKAIEVLKPDGRLFECRIEGGRNTRSGYFKQGDVLVRELRKQDLTDGSNVYINLQMLDESCYGRKQRDKFMAVKTTTSDNDVTGYDWFFVDIDPDRPKDTSSTDKQLDYAKQTANKVYDYLAKMGFENPVVAMSGNGVHLLYRVNLNVNDQTKKLLKNCMEVLNMYFNDEHVKIDVVNFNPSRICKLYGTLAQKGADTPEQPHRMSKIIKIPEEVKPTDIKYLEKLASKLPKIERSKDYSYRSASDFDVRDWLTKNGLHFRESSYSGGDKFILDCCPFDSNHKGKDAAVFRGKDGALGFHCFHNSCADKTWKDVRLLFEPDAYEKKHREEYNRSYKQFNRDRKPVEEIKAREGEPIWYNAMDIFNLPKLTETFIKTGVTQIDKATRGLQKGRVSLVSGLRGSGKSSVLSQWILDAVDAGNNVGCFSGELSSRNFMRWMMQQAAGKPFVENGLYEGYYNVPRKYQEVIAKWLGDHFWLYNNEYGNNFEQILKEFTKAIDEKKLDLLILDNLMAFDISTLSDSKFDAQTKFILELTSLAKKKNVHICFVAHPRKSLGFLRLQDVSGSADLANAVDYAFIVHRNNEDFKRLSMQNFGWKEGYDIYRSTNVIEIAKDRDGGTQDVFVPLWYEPESKRLKNDPTETKFYGWCKQKEPDEEEFDLGIDDWDDSGETPFDAE